MQEDFQQAQGSGGGSIVVQLILNLLTAVTLLLAIAIALVFGAVMINPYLPFNPYPPPTLPATLGPPTATKTPEIYLPSTWTPSITFTEVPSITPTPTETETPPPPPGAGTETATPETQSDAQFLPQQGSPSYIADERGCEHMGVGGKVFDLSGAAISGLAVRVGGELAGAPVGPMDSLTGSAADRFGFGGYYFELADSPVASQDTVWVQLLDSSSGLPLSDQLYLTTYDSCDQNLILINWRQVQP